MGRSRSILRKAVADMRRRVTIREALRSKPRRRSRKQLQHDADDFWSSGLGKAIYYGVIIGGIAVFAIRIVKNRAVSAAASAS